VPYRKALRVLAERFGAVPPAKPGAAASCRQCGAPLPDESGALLVRCVYCRSQNVLGVDPRPAALRQRQERSELQAALRGRRRARLRLALTLPICALLGVATVREAVLLWWIPVLDVSAFCAFGHCGTIENKDLVRRSLSLTGSDGEDLVRATMLPRSSLFWSCPEDCSITTDGHLTVASSLETQSTLYVVHGALQTAPGTALPPPH